MYGTFSVDPSVEYRLVVQALRLNTLSKLTFADSKRFDQLVQDVFPGVPFRDVEYAELESALREACLEQNLVIIDAQVRIKVHIIFAIDSDTHTHAHTLGYSFRGWIYHIVLWYYFMHGTLASPHATPTNACNIENVGVA